MRMVGPRPGRALITRTLLRLKWGVVLGQTELTRQGSFHVKKSRTYGSWTTRWCARYPEPWFTEVTDPEGDGGGLYARLDRDMSVRSSCGRTGTGHRYKVLYSSYTVDEVRCYNSQPTDVVDSAATKLCLVSWSFHSHSPQPRMQPQAPSPWRTRQRGCRNAKTSSPRKSLPGDRRAYTHSSESRGT